MRMYRFGLVAAVGVAMVCSVASAGSPLPVLPVVVFNETFDGGAFSEASSTFSGPDISFGANEAVWFNTTNVNDPNPGDGTHNTTSITGAAGLGDTEYTVSVDILADGIIGCCTSPEIFRAYISPYDTAQTTNEVDIRIQLVPTRVPGSTGFDLRVIDKQVVEDHGNGFVSGSATPLACPTNDCLGGLEDHGVNQGLALAFGTVHSIGYHHKGNAAHEIALHVNGGLVGTFTDRDFNTSFDWLSTGNNSTDPGIDPTGSLDNVVIRNVPEPASMLLFGLGLLALRRRS